MTKNNSISLWDRISLVGATWFGSGLLPKMPGTWGTIACVPLIAALVYFLDTTGYAVATVIITIASIPFASNVARLNRENPDIAKLNPHSKQVFKDEKLQKLIKGSEGQEKDPGMIVIDEVAGYAAAMLFLPFSVSALFITFVLFRAFDILKPPPVRQVESIGGGTGIVLDDTVAGLYACLLTHGFFYIYGLLNLPVLP